MATKRKTSSVQLKNKRRFITLQSKVNMIDLLRNGMSIVHVARKFGCSERTVRRFRDREKEIRQALSSSTSAAAGVVSQVHDKSRAKTGKSLDLCYDKSKDKNPKCVPIKKKVLHKHGAKTSLVAQPKKPRPFLTLQEKVAVLDLLRDGMTVSSVARKYDRNRSSITSIRKREEKIRRAISSDAPTTAKVINRVFDKTPVITEKLNLWLRGMNSECVPVTGNDLQEKACSFYGNFKPPSEVEEVSHEQTWGRSHPCGAEAEAEAQAIQTWLPEAEGNLSPMSSWGWSLPYGSESEAGFSPMSAHEEEFQATQGWLNSLIAASTSETPDSLDMPAKKIFTQKETLAIIKKLERGERPASIARSYSVNESSIRTIRKNADKIKAALGEATPISAKPTTHVQNPLLEKMEKMLSVWLKDQHQKGLPISSPIIRKKALQLYQHIEGSIGSSSTIEPFQASKVWLDQFMKRQNLHISTRGDVASPVFWGEPVTLSDDDKEHETVATEFPVTQEFCEVSPPRVQDPQKTIEIHTVDDDNITDGGNFAEVIGFPMDLGTHNKFSSPLQDPLQPKKIQMQHRNHCKDVMEVLACDEAFLDVTLTAEGRAIRAHKLVLSAVSPYFQQVLSANPCRHPVIIMPYHVQFDHLTHILEYIYKGEMTIAEDLVEPLLKTAKLLQISGLSTSDPAPLITENSLPSDPEMNHPPMRSSNLAKDHSSGGTVPLTPKDTIHRSDPSKISRPSRSCVTFKSAPKNTKAQLNTNRLVNTPVSLGVVGSETVCGPDAPVNISRPLPAGSRTDHDPIQEDFCEADIDIKEEELQYEGEEDDELSDDDDDDDAQQEGSRPDPLGTLPKFKSSHSAKPNSNMLPEPFCCPYCDEKHRDMNRMKVHLNRKHPFRPKFFCACGRVFVRPIQHQAHVKRCSNSEAFIKV